MTREQIEKGIECCNPYDENCGDCPFHDLPLGRCFEVLATTAFNMLLDDREKLQKQVKEYQDKIEQGTLIELPCKVGDTVYLPWEYGGIFAIAYLTVTHIILRVGRYCIKTNFETDIEDYYEKYKGGQFDFNDFGKIVFTNTTEAEARLKELQGNSDADDNI